MAIPITMAFSGLGANDLLFPAPSFTHGSGLPGASDLLLPSPFTIPVDSGLNAEELLLRLLLLIGGGAQSRESEILLFLRECNGADLGCRWKSGKVLPVLILLCISGIGVCGRGVEGLECSSCGNGIGPEGLLVSMDRSG